MSLQRNNSPKDLVGMATVLVLAAFALWWWFGRAEQTTLPLPPTAQFKTKQGQSPSTPAAPVPAKNPSPLTNSVLKTAIISLQGAPDATAARKSLAALRATLSAMPTHEAVGLIRQFLDSKADVSTQLGFRIGAHGLLDDAPTLRVYLLDELSRLDPAEAADYAKVILASKDSSDEWAVALRNLARGDDSDAGRTLLQQKTRELLQCESWRQNPSTGFLEAFDVAVYLGGDGLMPTLTDLIRQQTNPAVAHASFLALDRLVLNNPIPTLNGLLADPGLMQGRELTRADYFSRADVGDPRQRQILESYLLNPSTTAAEIDAFASVFPNADFMISPNLLTQSPTLDHTTLVNRDAASLRVAQAWLEDPRFAQLRPELQKTVSRLQGFVRQENGSR